MCSNQINDNSSNYVFQYTFLHIALINRKISIYNFFQVQADAFSKEITDTLEKRKKTGQMVPW